MRSCAICLLFYLFFAGCSKQLEPSAPYYAFDRVGEEVLSGLNIGDTIHFQGSNGANRKYLVFAADKIKEQNDDCSWNTGGCRVRYYYDIQDIQLVRIDTAAAAPNERISGSLIKTMQPELDSVTGEKGAAKVHLYGDLVDYNAVPDSSSNSFRPIFPFPDYYATIDFESYANVRRTYTEVSIIRSGNNFVYTDSITLKRYTVNEVWFDKKFGIVYFSDVFGNSWSRTN